VNVGGIIETCGGWICDKKQVLTKGELVGERKEVTRSKMSFQNVNRRRE
jgi:hypothetical protein